MISAPSSDYSLSLLLDSVRDVRDFPKPGIVFKDVTPILADGRLFREAIEGFPPHAHLSSKLLLYILCEFLVS